MKILLIAGHGGTDNGACAFGRKESDLARELVPMIREALIEYNVEVDIYNPARSAYHDIIANGYDYNFKKYDYVLEVHFNAYRKDPGNGRTTGTEIYVTPNEKIVTVEQSIVRRIAALGLTNRGVKREKMAVIMRAKAQGVSGALLEVCFMDDSDDMRVYDAKKQQIAQAVADGIADGYKLSKKGEFTMAGFKDTAGNWAEETIEKMHELGIVGGYPDGTFQPGNPITRAEATVMMYRLYEKLK